MLETGVFPQSRAAGAVDLCQLDACAPRRNSTAVIRGFNFNLPEIIGDLKTGYFRDSYPEEPVLLVFSPGEKGVVVTQINEFGRDLLDLSGGSASLEEIAGDLYQRYGSGMGRESFIDECRQAICTLMEMELLQRP
jgi:hypothetical protein